MKLGIVMEPWKVGVFTRHLQDAGLKPWRQAAASGMVTLVVRCDSPDDVSDALDAAASECQQLH